MTLEHTMRDIISKLNKILTEADQSAKDPSVEAKRKALQDIKSSPAAQDPKIKKAIDDKQAELAEDPVDDFLARGGKIQQLKSRNPRKSEKTNYGSKHIGGQRDAVAGKAGKTLGRAAATNFMGSGKAVVGEGFEIGDGFGISFSEDFEIGAEIVDIVEDGIVIELDDAAMGFLLQEGFSYEDGELAEGVAGAQKCWKGFRKVGTKAGTGANAGKRVNACKKIGEDEEVDESGLQYHTGVKKHGKEYMVKAAAAGREGASQKELGALKDKYSKAYKEDSVAEDNMNEAEYQGRKVQLGKKMAGDVKKSKVYVKNPQGNVVKVNFGDKKMKIKKSNPARRKSFRARHNCANPGPRHKARYWSCKSW